MEAGKGHRLPRYRLRSVAVAGGSRKQAQRRDARLTRAVGLEGVRCPATGEGESEGSSSEAGPGRGLSHARGAQPATLPGREGLINAPSSSPALAGSWAGCWRPDSGPLLSRRQTGRVQGSPFAFFCPKTAGRLKSKGINFVRRGGRNAAFKTARQ